MSFKNRLEEQCYNIAKERLGQSVSVEHNKKIQIERALYPEVASFSGPPTKEIDVLTTSFPAKPEIVLLVSCKQLSGKAEPAHIQEWGAVVQAMNKYGNGTVYLGLIICPSGFTKGCEPWATSHNIGLLPPLKGKSLAFSEDTVLQMFNRIIIALNKRLSFSFDGISTPPTFYDFVYSIVADYESYNEAISSGRYFQVPKGWLSTFGEMYSTVANRTIDDLFAVEGATVVKLSGGVTVRFKGNSIDYGTEINIGSEVVPACYKNLEKEPCDFDFIKSIVKGLKITSAADFGESIEYGLDDRYNLRFYLNAFQLYSTENPIEAHLL